MQLCCNYFLTQLAGQVNFVWNYVNDLSFKYLKRHNKFLSAYDIATYTKGASKECDLHSQTLVTALFAVTIWDNYIQSITETYVIKRKQFKKAKLRWRVSNPKSSRKSLGWIPFKKVAIKYGDGWVSYGKHIFKLWDSYGLSKYQVRTGFR